jgi:hypothetical protein
MPKISRFESEILNRTREKTSSLSEEEVFERVLAAILPLKEKLKLESEYVELKRTEENGLAVCSRDEVLTALEYIQGENENRIEIPRRNYILEKRGPLRREADGTLHVEIESFSQPPEEAPLTFRFLKPFDNWYATYKLKHSVDLPNLNPANLEKIRVTVSDIAQKLEINPKESVQIDIGIGIRDSTSRRDSLDFLKNKRVISTYKLDDFEDSIEVRLNVDSFLAFKQKLQSHYEEKILGKKPSATSKQIPTGLRWEDIGIKFQDSETVRIKAKEWVQTVTFRDMGFEDKRNRKPNEQWELLLLLSEKHGQMSWERSDAKPKWKKTKQRLSDSLKLYFEIEDDPFLPYSIEGQYKVKFKLLPE